MLDLKRYPKRSPNWYIRGTLKGISVFESTGTSRRPEAEAYLAKRWREIWDSGVLGQRPVATFADAVIAYTNHGGPRRYVTPLLHHFKERPLPEIGQAEIDAAAQALYPETSPATRLRQVYTPMIAILRHAADAKLPGASAPRIKKPKVEKKPPVWGTDEHVMAIANAPAEPRANDATLRVRALVLVATCTGLRASELIRQRRRDYLLRPGWVAVDRTKQGEPTFKPLWPEALAAVEAIMPARDNEPVFGFATTGGARKALRRSAERAGMPHLSMHRIGRHSFAARILNAGYDIKTLKEAGGWKKLATVDEIYGHLEINRVHDAMLAVAPRAESVQRPRDGKKTDAA